MRSRLCGNSPNEGAQCVEPGEHAARATHHVSSFRKLVVHDSGLHVGAPRTHGQLVVIATQRRALLFLCHSSTSLTRAHS